jgi:hypothetical protein
VDTLEQKESTVQDALRLLTNALTTVTSRIVEMDTEISGLDTLTTVLSTQSKAHESRFDRVESKLVSLVNYEAMEESILKTFEKILPDRVPVRVNAKTHELDLDPKFIRLLESKIENIALHLSTKQESTSQDRTDAIEVEEAHFKSLLNSASQDGLVMSQREVVSLLRREFDSVRTEMEEREKAFLAKVHRKEPTGRNENPATPLVDVDENKIQMNMASRLFFSRIFT